MKNTVLRKVLSVISLILAGVMCTGTLVANMNANNISSILSSKTFETIETGDGNQDTEYYKSVFSSIGELREEGHKTATEVLEEGTVLLKNENNALPLAKGSKVSLVGVTAYDPVYGGTGSGTISVSDAVNYVASLEAAGLEVNSTLTELYTSEDWAQYKRGTDGSFGATALMIREAPWSVVDAAAGSTFAQFGDAAIFVLGRVGGEGYDLKRGNSDGIDNGDGLGHDYLGLNENEISVLNGLKEKSMYATRNRIALTFMGNGADLAFMDPMDIYSMFGNLLDNAIVAVGKVEDPEKKAITLVTERKGQLVFLNIVNYMENRVLSFTDNLPDSTKTEEPGFHGYGLRSVRAIAKKYGGDVSVAVTDDLFNVNVYLMADEKAGNG